MIVFCYIFFVMVMTDVTVEFVYSEQACNEIRLIMK